MLPAAVDWELLLVALVALLAAWALGYVIGWERGRQQANAAWQRAMEAEIARLNALCDKLDPQIAHPHRARTRSHQ